MQAMPQAQGSSGHSCLSHIQQSPPCFDSQHKKTDSTTHETLYNTITIHSKHAWCHKSLNSQKSLSIYVSLSITDAVTLPPRLSHNFPCSPATQSRSLPYNFVICCDVVPFSTNRNMFSCLQALAACGHFCNKSPFLPFLPEPNAQLTWRQCSWKSVADII